MTYRSFLERGPRPEYEIDYGNEAEIDIVARIINEIPGLICEKDKDQEKAKREDQTSAIDLWVSMVEDLDYKIPVQCSMSTNQELIERKKKRLPPGGIFIHLPKTEVSRSHEQFRSQKEQSPDLEWNSSFITPELKRAIFYAIYQHPKIRRHLESLSANK